MGFWQSTSFGLQILLALLCGDFEKNPGPKRTPKASLSISQWNLISISTHSYVKLSLLRAYREFHKFDIIFLSETYHNSSNSSDDETLEISEYNLVRSTVHVEEFAFTIKITYPYEISASIIYQNV